MTYSQMLSFWFCCVTRVGYSCVSRNAGGEGKSEYNSEKRKSNRILRKQGTSMSIATVQTLSLLILFQCNSFFFKCGGISEQLPRVIGSVGTEIQIFIRPWSDHSLPCKQLTLIWSKQIIPGFAIFKDPFPSLSHVR